MNLRERNDLQNFLRVAFPTFVIDVRDGSQYGYPFAIRVTPDPTSEDIKAIKKQTEEYLGGVEWGDVQEVEEDK